MKASQREESVPSCIYSGNFRRKSENVRGRAYRGNKARGDQPKSGDNGAKIDCGAIAVKSGRGAVCMGYGPEAALAA